MYTYDITVSWKGYTKTYRDFECEMHDEFYVKAILYFESWLKSMGVKVPPPQAYGDDSYKTSYVRREKSLANYAMVGDWYAE